jgi:carboxyl-terminal processing protease
VGRRLPGVAGAVARLAVALLLAGVVVLGAGPAGAEQRASQAAPAAEATAANGVLAHAVIGAIERRFFDEARMRAIDWPRRAAAAHAAARKAASRDEAVAILRSLLAELRTSHTDLFTPDDVEYYILADVVGGREAIAELWGAPPVVAGIGVFTTRIENRIFVEGVLEGSPADTAGLKTGDEIVAVDGAPYRPVASFRNKAGTSVEVTVRSARDGPTRTLTVPVALMQPSQAFALATRNSARVIERAGRRIGYVHLWSVRDGEELGRAIARIDPSRPMGPAEGGRGRRGSRDGPTGEPLDALIVDNRVKIGGMSGVIRHWLNALDERSGALTGRSRGARGAIYDGPSLRGRTAMLIDHRTRSAAELFAYAFRRERLGPLIGTRTAGAVSAGAAEAMPGGLILYIAVTGLAIDGVKLEGVGVAPDIVVERPLPYSAGADPVLEAAIAHLAAVPAAARD